MIMPDMGGRATFEHMKEINPEVKVILTSGYSVRGEAEKMLEQGCLGFFKKPFDIGALSKKIAAVLKGEEK